MLGPVREQEAGGAVRGRAVVNPAVRDRFRAGPDLGKGAVADADADADADFEEEEEDEDEGGWPLDGVTSVGAVGAAEEVVAGGAENGERVPGEPAPAAQPGGPGTGSGGLLAGVGQAGRLPTRTLVVAGVVVLMVVLVGLVAVVRAAHDGTGSTPQARATAAEPTPTPLLAAAVGEGVAPTAAGVAAVLNPLMASAALGKVNASVVDPATGTQLYGRSADIMTTPASTTKLLTATAVLATRGPAYRLTTRVVAGAEPGEIVLVGGGDPTLAIDAKHQLFAGSARLDQLAAQVKAALGGQKVTRVLVDTSLFTGPTSAVGWDSDDISGGQVAPVMSLMTNDGRVGSSESRYSNPALAAGKQFAQLLGVSAPVSSGTAPAGVASAGSAISPGTQLGAVQSPPLVEVIDWMLQQSDNTIAESMGRQVALATGHPASFDGATDAIVSELADLGLPSDEADIYDASGLSRHNGIAPALLTSILALIAGGTQPDLTSIFGGLPVAGWSGTLEDRFLATTSKAAQGRVRAKTGSLSGVNTMAGELVTKDGRLLVFAVMSNGTGDATTTRAALDSVAAKLLDCGCSG